jgi:Na+-driven multidrug efflux pump
MWFQVLSIGVPAGLSSVIMSVSNILGNRAINDGPTIEAGRAVMHAFVWGLPFIGSQVTLMVSFQSFGKPVQAMIITLAACCTCGFFAYTCKKFRLIGMLLEFARYKYSFYEYLYYFMREAQQTPGAAASVLCSAAVPLESSFRL